MLESEIESINAKLMKHLEAGNASGIAALYHDEACLVPSRSDPFEGRAAIQGFFQAGIDGGIRKIEIKTLDVEDYGDTAIEFGLYHMFVDNGQAVDHGHYLVVWKRSDGVWQLYRDVLSTAQS